MKTGTIKLHVVVMLICFLAMTGLAATTLYCMANNSTGTVVGGFGALFGFITLLFARSTKASKVCRIVYCVGLTAVCLLTVLNLFADYTDLCIWTTFAISFLFFGIVKVLRTQTYHDAEVVHGEIVEAGNAHNTNQ